MDRVLTLENLQIGMRVKKEQLENIFGVYIYFDSYDEKDGGRIIHFCKVPDDEAMRIVKENGRLSTFYQDEDYAEESKEYYD